MAVFARSAEGLGVIVSHGASETAYRTTTDGSVLGLSTSPTFFRCMIVATNYVYQVSADGQNYVTVVTVAKTTQFTTAADQWGFFANTQTASFDAGLTLLSFKET